MLFVVQTQHKKISSHWLTRLSLSVAVSLLMAPIASAQSNSADLPITQTYIPVSPAQPSIWQTPYPSPPQTTTSRPTILSEDVAPLPGMPPTVTSPPFQFSRQAGNGWVPDYANGPEPQSPYANVSPGVLREREAAARQAQEDFEAAQEREKTRKLAQEKAKQDALAKAERLRLWEERQGILKQEKKAQRLAKQQDKEAKATLKAEARAKALYEKQAAKQAKAEARAKVLAEAKEQAAIKKALADKARKKILAEREAARKAKYDAKAKALAERKERKALKKALADEARAKALGKKQALKQAKTDAKEKAKMKTLAEIKEREAAKKALAAKEKVEQAPKATLANAKEGTPADTEKQLASPPKTAKAKSNTGLEDYNRGVEIFNYAQLQLQNGNFKGHLEQLKLARTTFETALRADPTMVEAQSNIGYVYLTEKNYKKAIKAFNKALLINENHLASLNGLATTYTLRHKFVKALGYYKTLTKLAPGNDQYWFNQGSVLQRMTRHDDAKTAYDEAVKINPNNQRAWFNVGTLYENKGATEQALLAYQKVKTIDLGNPIGLEALNRIKQIQSKQHQESTETSEDSSPGLRKSSILSP